MNRCCAQEPAKRESKNKDEDCSVKGPAIHGKEMVRLALGRNGPVFREAQLSRYAIAVAIKEASFWKVGKNGGMTVASFSNRS